MLKITKHRPEPPKEPYKEPTDFKCTCGCEFTTDEYSLKYDLGCALRSIKCPECGRAIETSTPTVPWG